MLKQNSSSAVLPSLEAGRALFLDIDGTLSPIAARPNDASIPTNTMVLLVELEHALNGAVALVSGRSIIDIDRMCEPYTFNAAGQHGLEIRQNGRISMMHAERQGLMEELAAHIRDFQQHYPKVFVEYKGLSIALHYRTAPILEETVTTFAEAMAMHYGPVLLCQKGKMVVELRLSGADKGKAIASMMQHPPFAGNRPVFVGDDTTDEDGFTAVNDLGGVTIKVGPGKTYAHYRLHGTNDVQRWLRDSISAIHLTSKA